MPAWAVGAVRTGLQALWGIGAAWLIARHIPVPAEVPAIVQAVVLAAIVAAAAGVVQWAERRAGGPGIGGKLAALVRWLARIIMLGQRVAIYPKTKTDENTTYLTSQIEREQRRPAPKAL